MAKGSRYDQQFKENAVRYRLDTQSSHSKRQQKIWELVTPLLRHGCELPEKMREACQHGEPGIIPAMRRKRLPACSVNSEIQRMLLKS